MPTEKYRCSFQVRSYECDALGHVNNAVYQQYLEETATLAADALGFPREWYIPRGETWVMHRIGVEYLRPAFAREVLLASTWISSRDRVRSNREYELVRKSDGEPVVRASVEWVYVDLRTGRPRSIPAAFSSDFIVNAPPVLRPYRLPDVGLESHEYRWRHKVRYHEIDVNQHVNNAVYLNWLEEAKILASAEAGWTLERMKEAGFLVLQTRHDTEYLAPTAHGDEVEVVSRLYDLRSVRGTWLHEVRRVGSGDLVLRNYSTGAFLDLDGKPTRPPQAFLDDLIAGPAAERR